MTGFFYFLFFALEMYAFSRRPNAYMNGYLSAVVAIALTFPRCFLKGLKGQGGKLDFA